MAVASQPWQHPTVTAQGVPIPAQLRQAPFCNNTFYLPTESKMVAAKCGHGNLFEAAFWQRTSNTTVVEVQAHRGGSASTSHHNGKVSILTDSKLEPQFFQNTSTL